MERVLVRPRILTVDHSVANELMRRREVLAFVGAIAAWWPVRVAAQQQARMRRIGVLMPLGADDPQGQIRLATLRRALEERGWAENQNLHIDVRWGPADANRYRELAAQLVALAPDLLLAGGGLVVAPLQMATRTIPIVFTATVDPVALGYVASLSQPGGNTTGFINFEYSLCGKWVETLKEIAPRVRRVAVIEDPTGPGGIGTAQFKEIVKVAPQYGVEATPIDVRDADNLERGMTSFAREARGDGGLVVTASTYATVRRDLIIMLAARERLPAVYPVPFYVAAGGLISYGPVFLDQYRRAADYVDRILKGAKPGDLPVQGPVRFEMAVNLKTAKALGLQVPNVVLVSADQVIE
jgi:putative ABC transport system substrate-binding protein